MKYHRISQTNERALLEYLRGVTDRYAPQFQELADFHASTGYKHDCVMMCGYLSGDVLKVASGDSWDVCARGLRAELNHSIANTQNPLAQVAD